MEAAEAAAAEAEAKARDEEEAKASARRQEILRTPTAEELRNMAAEKTAARVNASDNQDQAREDSLDKRAERMAAKAAAAPPLSKLRTHLGKDKYPSRPYKGGNRRRTANRHRKVRNSTFRRHRKH